MVHNLPDISESKDWRIFRGTESTISRCYSPMNDGNTDEVANGKSSKPLKKSRYEYNASSMRYSDSIQIYVYRIFFWSAFHFSDSSSNRSVITNQKFRNQNQITSHVRTRTSEHFGRLRLRQHFRETSQPQHEFSSAQEPRHPSLPRLRAGFMETWEPMGTCQKSEHNSKFGFSFLKKLLLEELTF